MMLRTLVLLCVMIVLASVQPVAAQEAAGLGRDPSVSARPLSLSLDDAVRLALEHNLDIVVDRLEPQVSAARVGQAASAFVPSLTSVLTRTRQTQAPTNPLLGTTGVETGAAGATVTLAQRVPWFGGSVAVGWDASRTTTTSSFTNFSPSVTSRVQVTVSQPLLRDLMLDAPRQQLEVSKRNRDMSDARFRETVSRTLNSVKRAYWDLVSARSSVEVQGQSLTLAQDLARINKARVDVGQMPEIDLLAAQAEVAQRQEALLVAQVAARQAEDRLRMLILDPADQAFWQTPLQTTDAPPVGGGLPDIDRAVASALRSRLDLSRARLELENARTATRFYSSQRLPDLRVQANYQASGLSGTRLVRTGGFPGTISGSEEVGFGRAIDQILARDYPTWSATVTLSYPIGRSYEDAALAAARLQERQAGARVQNLEMRIVRQIRQAVWQLEMNASRIQTSRAARQLAERRADSEQKRFEVGLSTSFLVVQAQRDLAQARNNELSAILDYARSLTDFETLQETALDQTGSTVTVSSGGAVSAAGAVPAATAQTSSTTASSTTRIGGQ